MATEHDPGRVTMVVCDAAHHPGDAGPHLPHDLVNRHQGAQRIIDHHRGEAQRLRPQRHATKVFGRQRPPVAPVDEHPHRRIGLCRRKNIQRFIQRRAIRHVQRAWQLLARPLGLVRIAFPASRSVRHRRARVVLRVDLGLGGEVSVQRVERGVGHFLFHELCGLVMLNPRNVGNDSRQ